MSSENNEHMVERVARAIYGIPQRWPKVEDRVRDTYRADARRALEASHHEELVEALAAYSILKPRIEQLFPAIAHGDGEHRAWLKEAIDAHFAGEPVPQPRGRGAAEARIEQLGEALRRSKRLIGRSLDHGARVMSDQALGEALKGIEAALNPQQDGGE